MTYIFLLQYFFSVTVRCQFLNPHFLLLVMFRASIVTPQANLTLMMRQSWWWFARCRNFFCDNSLISTYICVCYVWRLHSMSTCVRACVRVCVSARKSFKTLLRELHFWTPYRNVMAVVLAANAAVLSASHRCWLDPKASRWDSITEQTEAGI